MLKNTAGYILTSSRVFYFYSQEEDEEPYAYELTTSQLCCLFACVEEVHPDSRKIRAVRLLRLAHPSLSLSWAKQIAETFILPEIEKENVCVTKE